MHYGTMHGIVDEVGAYWSSKWETLKAKFASLIGTLLQTREKILRTREQLKRALRVAQQRGDKERAAQIREAIAEGDALLKRQDELEGKVREAQQKIQSADADAGLGFEPITIIAGAAALVALVIGGIIVHTQLYLKWKRRADLLSAGLIRPGELEGPSLFSGATTAVVTVGLVLLALTWARTRK